MEYVSSRTIFFGRSIFELYRDDGASSRRNSLSVSKEFDQSVCQVYVYCPAWIVWKNDLNHVFRWFESRCCFRILNSDVDYVSFCIVIGYSEVLPNRVLTIMISSSKRILWITTWIISCRIISPVHDYGSFNWRRRRWWRCLNYLYQAILKPVICHIFLSIHSTDISTNRIGSDSYIGSIPSK